MENQNRQQQMNQSQNQNQSQSQSQKQNNKTQPSPLDGQVHGGIMESFDQFANVISGTVGNLTGNEAQEVPQQGQGQSKNQ
ncbi:hypothetical protein M3181_04020 [Mesobacillus maritimus]|uniref:hypothetical protein n=1 Tax=Mesobacillus maritimus TaxID=1643336 RepID=UPI00203F795B|nr:hypothetical protein [Mesobacillus maritimus]MCM3668167.1 hypothetical protein [Mesobacillus maritimus]